MGLFDYGVGGSEQKIDANEAIGDISGNKSLIVSKLTNEDPFTPEMVHDLKRMEDVFERFNPSVDVDYEDQDGNIINEKLTYKNLGDFTPKSLVKESDYLNNQQISGEQYNKILRQLKNNKILKNILQNSESKEALLGAFNEMLNELEK